MADREMQILHLMGHKWPRGNLIPSHLILCPRVLVFFFSVTENILSLASSENLRRRKRKGFRKEGALGNG